MMAIVFIITLVLCRQRYLQLQTLLVQSSPVNSADQPRWSEFYPPNKAIKDLYLSAPIYETSDLKRICF